MISAFFEQPKFGQIFVQMFSSSLYQILTNSLCFYRMHQESSEVPSGQSEKQDQKHLDSIFRVCT